MKFYNRMPELGLLEQLYKNKPSFVVLTGKRRVGKTELIKQFCKDKRSLYLFVDSNKTSDILLEEFQEEIKEELRLPEYIRFGSFGDMIEFLFDQEEDLVVAIDEFQRFLKVDPTFITQLQKYWDLKGQDSKVFLIASGSSMGMIKKIFIEEKAPLFKRADAIINLSPFSIKEIFQVLNDLGIKKRTEKFDIYSLFGGTIYYYRLIEKFGVRSFKDALDKLVLNDLAPLKREVGDILIEEFGKTHATYFEILSAMAYGKSTKKDIGDSTHISSTSLSPYLYDLNDILQVVEYSVPAGEVLGKSKKGLYRLKDNFFRFYFRFIYRNMSLYQIGKYDSISKKINTHWNDFKGRILEDLALEHARRRFIDDYPIIGRFWDRTGNEIDIVGINKKTRTMLLMEVKFKKLEKNECLHILDTLESKREIVPFRTNRTQYGIVASEIPAKKSIEEKGYIVITLPDILK